LANIIPGLLTALDSVEAEDYARYFTGGADSGMPQRSGYYLGYRIAVDLGKSRSLDQLSKISPQEIRKIIEHKLKMMLAHSEKK
jgi:uncharacterized protein YjaZ